MTKDKTKIDFLQIQGDEKVYKKRGLRKAKKGDIFALKVTEKKDGIICFNFTKIKPE